MATPPASRRRSPARGGGAMNRPLSTSDLSPAERRFADIMRELSFGRFEFLQIQSGEVVLDPWPTTVRGVKFGSADPVATNERPDEFELKKQVAELFEF